MTEQQLRYAYWQRMRQQQLYRIYAAGIGTDQPKKNSYDRIAKVSGSYFLNYLEYSPKNIDSQKAADYLKNLEVPISCGKCSGVYDKRVGKALRQLDWYFNNESEFIVKMNKDENKGVFASIGVTAASPKMTADIARHYITTGEYYEYFDVLPFFTVDGVNENGVFAQSNVVNKHNIEININKDDPSKTDCCIVMVVRYILDKFDTADMATKDSVKAKIMNNLHIYGTSKLGGYNSHILVACHAIRKSYVIEFTADDCIVNEFPIMTNFRTIDNQLNPININEDKTVIWDEIESDGIGLERWDTAARFLKTGTGSDEEIRRLRQRLNYVHAYDRPFVKNQTWLTDNLSGDLTVSDAKNCHDNGISPEFQEALDGYREQFNARSRNTGKTWITTHGAIYDLINLSCNIKSQMSTDEETCWNVLFDGQISEDKNIYEGLCFTAEQPNSSVMLKNVNGAYQTSVDGKNWTDYQLGQDISLSKAGDKVYFAAKNTNDNCWNGNTDEKKFVMTGKIAASGNIQSLLDKQCDREDVPAHCYSCIFRDCESLVKPPILPATILAEQCYDAMFLDCTSLITAPALPADPIVQRCYQFMFKGCSSLTAAPELPATVIAPFCYDTMFGDCISLTAAPALSSEVLHDYCYANMFNGCSGLNISENGQAGSIVLDLKNGTTEADEWNKNMFEGTGGSFKGSPAIGKTYRCYR